MNIGWIKIYIYIYRKNYIIPVTFHLMRKLYNDKRGFSKIVFKIYNASFKFLLFNQVSFNLEFSLTNIDKNMKLL